MQKLLIYAISVATLTNIFAVSAFAAENEEAEVGRPEHHEFSQEQGQDHPKQIRHHCRKLQEETEGELEERKCQKPAPHKELGRAIQESANFTEILVQLRLALDHYQNAVDQGDEDSSLYQHRVNTLEHFIERLENSELSDEE
jgi:hypothetical protein